MAIGPLMRIPGAAGYGPGLGITRGGLSSPAGNLPGVGRETVAPPAPGAGTAPITRPGPAPAAGQAHEQVSFWDMLRRAAGEVSARQNEADAMAGRLAAGEVDIHEAVLVAEKANLTLELAVAVRNRALEAYQEIMRMPV